MSFSNLTSHHSNGSDGNSNTVATSATSLHTLYYKAIEECHSRNFVKVLYTAIRDYDYNTALISNNNLITHNDLFKALNYCHQYVVEVRARHSRNNSNNNNSNNHNYFTVMHSNFLYLFSIFRLTLLSS